MRLGGVQAHSKGLYVEDKIDLLMGYLVVNPLAALMGTLFGWKAKEKTKKVEPLPLTRLLQAHCLQ